MYIISTSDKSPRPHSDSPFLWRFQAHGLKALPWMELSQRLETKVLEPLQLHLKRYNWNKIVRIICELFQISWCTDRYDVQLNFINSNRTPVASQHLSSLLVEHVQIPLHNSEPLQLQCKRRKRCNLPSMVGWWATHTFPGKKFNLKPRELGMSIPRICKDITLGPTFDNRILWSVVKSSRSCTTSTGQ